MLLVLGIFLFVLLVVAHEFGHFWAAKRSGVEVEEFGVGFPPRLAGRRYKGTLYSLNLIPLGGFVKLKGENDSDQRPGSFGTAGFKNKAKILMAGVAMNLVVAYGLFLAVALVGMPRLFDGQFSVTADEQAQVQQVMAAQVVPDSPAAAAGLVPGDVITAIDGVAVSGVEELIEATQSRPAQTVTVHYRRDGRDQQARVTLAELENGEGRLGVVPFNATAVRYTWSAPLVAAGLTIQTAWLTLVVFGGFIGSLVGSGVGAAMDQPVAGPVGIFTILSNLSDLGLVSYLLVIMASISVSLAVINTLPIPALDGGRLAVISLFRGLRRRLEPATESAIHSVGMLALLALIVLITVIDVRRLL